MALVRPSFLLVPIFQQTVTIMFSRLSLREGGSAIPSTIIHFNSRENAYVGKALHLKPKFPTSREKST
jgi:hypothetical protein